MNSNRTAESEPGSVDHDTADHREQGDAAFSDNTCSNTDGASRDREAGCPPPDEAIMVYCLHCGKEYMSSEMIPPDGARTPIMQDGMWWCGTPGCSAGGFGLDVFPVDPEWRDPKGLLHLHMDDELGDLDDLACADEFEWDDEDESDDPDDDRTGLDATAFRDDRPRNAS